MNTKTLLAAAALTGLAAAAPITQRSETTDFILLSIHSGSNIQNTGVTASGQRFWLDKQTSTYCPSSISCPSNTAVTALSFNSATTSLGMDTVVPGGQQVYVTADGQFGYTIAHSASIPEGAVTEGFAYTPETDGAPGQLTFNGFSFVACPKDNAYQVYVDSANTTDDCVSFLGATFNYTGSAAWEYA